MLDKNYHVSISANISAEEAIRKISDVSAWWSTDLSGSAKKVNDEFTVRFGETYVTHRVEEISGNKIVWLVTDCYKHWLKGNKQEWTGTKMVWEIAQDKTAIKVDFTHVGLVPGIECYEGCEEGWNFYIKVSLLKLLTAGKGEPSTPKANR